jgi:hypothetical protein
MEENIFAGNNCRGERRGVKTLILYLISFKARKGNFRSGLMVVEIRNTS